MDRSNDGRGWREISPPWYLDLLLGFAIAFAYTVTAITWLWWKSGEFAFLFTRAMREALWRQRQGLRGLVEVEEDEPAREEVRH